MREWKLFFKMSHYNVQSLFDKKTYEPYWAVGTLQDLKRDIRRINKPNSRLLQAPTKKFCTIEDYNIFNTFEVL